jgi:hypothetical protein
MNEIALRTPTQGNTMPVRNTDDVFALAKAFSQAKVLGAKNPAEGLLVYKLISEIGLVAATERYSLMMGTLGKRAHAIAADFLKAGGSYRVVRRDPECAELVASFGETKNMTFKFSWDDAQKEPFVYAGPPKEQKQELAKPVEKRTLKDKYATPRSRTQMLWARVISEMGQTLCPQACEGMYPPEVIADFDESERNITQRGEPGARPQPKGGVDVGHEHTQEAEFSESTEPESDPQPEPDYTRCPIGGPNWRGRPWTELEKETLETAVQSDKLGEGYKDAIREVLRGYAEA